MTEYAGIETAEEDEAVAGLVQKGDIYPITEADPDEPVAGLTEGVLPQLPDDEDE
jgi:hypothetical protein